MDEIIRLMVGRPLTNRFPPKDNVVGDEDILKVEGLTAEYSHLKDANIHVRKGEILGVAGLDSSGRTELLENIFGSATRKSGKIYKNGKLVGNKTPRESIKTALRWSRRNAARRASPRYSGYPREHGHREPEKVSERPVPQR